MPPDWRDAVAALAIGMQWPPSELDALDGAAIEWWSETLRTGGKLLPPALRAFLDE